MINIPFNRPPLTGNETAYIQQVISSRELCGGKTFAKKCEAWFQEKLGAPRAIMTPSCTAALEMAAMLSGCGEGDEVIVPSFTFVSTANAFVLRGAKIVFADIDPVTMNISADAIRAAITPRTKAIVVVHYAGVGCEMQAIMQIARERGIFVVEDAAQAIMADYCDKPLGSFGHVSCFSFHETKNVVCGEGGMLVINDASLVDRAEILQEKGTNRRKFINGQVDKYTWVDIGSSYLPSEMQAAFLYAQLEQAEKITADRLAAWNYYDAKMPACFEKNVVPQHCRHNAHIYSIKLRDMAERNALISFARERGVQMTFHYVPLHSSPAGEKFGVFAGEDRYTTTESARILRLPMFRDITRDEQDRVVSVLIEFAKQKNISEVAA